MLDFEFISPTKILFGRNSELSCGKAVRELGAKRILLLYYNDPGFLKTGLIERIKSSIGIEGLSIVEMSDIVPNARLSAVYKGIDLARAEKIDFIVAVGGGSVIDTAKGVAIGVPYEGDVWDFYCGKAVVQKALPIAAVVTLGAAGSEGSRVSVITKEEGNLKRACPSDLIRPVLAIMNPELAYTAPKFMIACGAYDIVSHVFERYFSPSEDVDLTDRLCEGTMLAAIQAGLQAVKDPQNYEAQATLLWSALIAQNDFLSTGRAKDGVCHNIEHEIGGLFDVSHGAGLAALFTSWANYVYKSNLRRFIQYAVRVWGCEMNFDHPERTALEGIRRTTEYIADLGLPTTLTQLGLPDLSEEVISELAMKATNGGKNTMGGIRVLDVEDIKNILRLAN